MAVRTDLSGWHARFDSNDGGSRLPNEPLIRRFGSFFAPTREQLFDTRYIGWYIHADSIVIRFDHANVEAILEPAQLFELFEALELAGRQRRKLQQRVAAEAI